MDKALKAGAIFDPDALHREKMFETDGPPPSYYWCMHCERAYPRGEFRPVGDLQMCPYNECDGDAAIDAWDWSSIRDGNPTYPETPLEGVIYPMYGSST